MNEDGRACNYKVLRLAGVLIQYATSKRELGESLSIIQSKTIRFDPGPNIPVGFKWEKLGKPILPKCYKIWGIGVVSEHNLYAGLVNCKRTDRANEEGQSGPLTDLNFNPSVAFLPITTNYHNVQWSTCLSKTAWFYINVLHCSFHETTLYCYLSVS